MTRFLFASFTPIFVSFIIFFTALMTASAESPTPPKTYTTCHEHMELFAYGAPVHDFRIPRSLRLRLPVGLCRSLQRMAGVDREKKFPSTKAPINLRRRLNNHDYRPDPISCATDLASRRYPLIHLFNLLPTRIPISLGTQQPHDQGRVNEAFCYTAYLGLDRRNQSGAQH